MLRPTERASWGFPPLVFFVQPGDFMCRAPFLCKALWRQHLDENAPPFVAWGLIFIRVGDRYVVRTATAAEREHFAAGRAA